jgi:hypothetical protein
MYNSVISCDTVESMVNIIVMLMRENIVFRADEAQLTIYLKGY